MDAEADIVNRWLGLQDLLIKHNLQVSIESGCYVIWELKTRNKLVVCTNIDHVEYFIEGYELGASSEK